MKFNRSSLTAAVALSLAAALALPAHAAEQYIFPSANGAAIAASTPQFVPPANSESGTVQAVSPAETGAISVTGASTGAKIPPLPVGSPNYKERFGVRSQSGDAYAYRFFTHALASQSFANYAADYYRLFTPGYAVQAWTDRVAGFVETGYGGAVDSWTGGAYYLARLRGPSRGRNSPPDLSTMPTFRAHPELETHPTFDKSN